MTPGVRRAASAREVLRAATEAAHLRLHALPDFRALAEGRLDRAGYAALLGRLLGYHLAVEQALEAGPPLAAFGLDLAARRRSHLLRADLAFLGRAAPPCEAPVPAPGDAAEALGMIYVTEGSTLGGRHLARALDGLLPPGEEGRRFLLGHGAAHGRMWRDCCAAIERCGATEAGRAGMLRGAVAAFAAFEAWFAPATPPA